MVSCCVLGFLLCVSRASFFEALDCTAEFCYLLLRCPVTPMLRLTTKEDYPPNYYGTQTYGKVIENRVGHAPERREVPLYGDTCRWPLAALIPSSPFHSFRDASRLDQTIQLVSISHADKSLFLSGYLLREHHGVLFEADGRELLGECGDIVLELHQCWLRLSTRSEVRVCTRTPDAMRPTHYYI